MRFIQFCISSFPASILLLSLSVYGCQSSQLAGEDLEDAKKEIADKNEMYFHSLAEGDSVLFARCYAEDCWIMPPDAPALCGPEAPFDYFRIIYLKQGIRNGKFITIDLYGNNGEFLIEVGFWKTVSIDNESNNGKFIVIWKKTADGLKRFRDSFSSDSKGKTTAAND